MKRLYTYLAKLSHRLALYWAKRANDLALDEQLAKWMDLHETREAVERDRLDDPAWAHGDTIAAMVAYGKPIPSAAFRDGLAKASRVVEQHMTPYTRKRLRTVK